MQGASGKPPACSDRQQLCRKQIPLVGIDAPTPARIGTGRPKGRSHFSFDGERKVCKRKPAARRLREKALDCPFLKEGVRNVARNGVGQLSPALGARSCSLFSSFKKGKAFSLRCLSPLCFPAVGVGQTYPLRGDVVSTTGLLCRFNERRLMIPHSRRGAYAALAGILLPSQ